MSIWTPSESSPTTSRGAPAGPWLWVAVIGAACALGLLVAVSAIAGVAALALVALVAAALASREFALGAVLVSAFLMLGAVAWLGVPGQAALLTKMLIGLLGLGVIVDWRGDRRPDIPMAFIALALTLCVSAVFGSAPRLLAAQALGAYLAAVVAYLAIVNSNLGIASLRRLSLLVICFMALQVPLILVQSRFIGNVDWRGGTFGTNGSTQLLAIAFGIVWTIAVALLTGRRAWWLIPIGVVIATTFMVNEAKAGFLFAAAGTVVVGLSKAVGDPRRGVRDIVIYSALGVGAVGVLYYGYVYFGGILPGGATQSFFYAHWLSNPSAIMDYLLYTGRTGQAGRIGGTILALGQARSLADLLIGHGPGLLSGSAITGESGVAGSAISYALGWATSLTRFVYEVGLLGLGLYLWALAAAVAAVHRAWAPVGGGLGVSVTAAAAGGVAVYVCGALYHQPWTTDVVAVPLWCLLGIAVLWGRLRSAENVAAQPGATDAAIAAVQPPEVPQG